MPIHNADVVAIFEEIADLLEIEEANPFRVRAYRNAARTLTQLSRPVADLVAEDEDLTELPGIGEDLAGKIEEIVRTGTLAQLEALERETEPELAELMRIPGLGPKRVRRLRDELGITTREALQQAAQSGAIRALKGFGAKMEQNILDGLEETGEERRWLLATAEPVATSLVEYLAAHDAVEQVDVAGSYRRRMETVGDLDVLVLSEDGPAVMTHFVDYDEVETVVAQGETRATVVLASKMQVDVRVVPSESYGAALLYFTGSKAHNVKLRNWAVKRGCKINEYGVFEGEDAEKRVAGATEDEIYGLFDLPFIVPELREDRGELETALEGGLPDLVTLDDLRGNLHTHTTSSDGRNTLAEMAEAARERGLEYLAITDHSPSVAITHGLDADALREQMDAIDALNEELRDVRLLKSIEVDILEDGSLDLPDDVLRDLDLCVGAIHSAFRLREEKQTARILRAMDNPNLHILAHPTGRLINRRPPMAFDLDRVMKAAREKGCFLEINAQPERLDLSDVYGKRAKELGLKLAIGADAHWTSGLDFLRYGVDQARRGWLEAGDVLNTKPWSEIAPLFDR